MIVMSSVTKKFGNNVIIRDLNLEVNDGDFISITGKSGKGKTTLLNMIGLLESPSSGKISIDGVSKRSSKEIMLLRRHSFGYLFQNYALIESDTVRNNLLLALKYRKDINKAEEIKKALDFVGLSNIEGKKIYQLSGGEQQRIALARVLLKDCSYVFADEPTGNLDTHNRDLVFDILRELNQRGKTIVFVTHDEDLANLANRRLDLS